MRDSHASPTEENERIRELITAGTQIVGGTSSGLVAGALGLLVAGPAGVAIGGAAGTALSLVYNRLGNEICERLLSPREQARVGFVLGQAAKEIRDLIEQGENLRSDGFFGAQVGGRSDAEEVAESVLLKSQREAEEKKLPYMAHLLANVAFTPQVSADMAHQISKVAEQLTYRQFCIMKIASDKDKLKLRNADYSDEQPFSYELGQVLVECIDLSNRLWISIDELTAPSVTMVNPSQIRLQGFGGIAFGLMQLDLIPSEDIEPVVAQLR